MFPLFHFHVTCYWSFVVQFFDHNCVECNVFVTDFCWFGHDDSNVPEAVYMQHLMGIDGVIVDFVQEITEAVADMMKPAKIGEEEGLTEGIGKNSKPQFSQQELSFLYKLIPQLLLL